ncbi:hypothetical protein [Alsobacter sp. R-9]
MSLRSPSLTRRAALPVLLAFTLAGCASDPIQTPVPIKAPNQLDIEGLKPSGKVALTEVVVAGAPVGRGTLTFKGKTYKFNVAGSVVGPGGLAKRNVSGNIYKLDSLEQFSGIWVEGTGPIGLETSGRSELWLENSNGVIMHLVGQSEGLTLSLGRDEVLIELSK